ncbi:unnamed protein product [Vitrella brassicaformis CCMP3155]|uniref:Uncharacterized protein n=1 Tax=Vitrella brassicaformis (strain CCMP3155) TaxID=1169540 RepID=A0A0G4ECN8_VITBC|nr:unnamed protein product [Vitrella brassicaformis CCMP3155]|eukprot:CEL93071.1 unnamed protein product [Vitrella brassicaformis CCMP3155]
MVMQTRSQAAAATKSQNGADLTSAHPAGPEDPRPQQRHGTAAKGPKKTSRATSAAAAAAAAHQQKPKSRRAVGGKGSKGEVVKDEGDEEPLQKKMNRLVTARRQRQPAAAAAAAAGCIQPQQVGRGKKCADGVSGSRRDMVVMDGLGGGYHAPLSGTKQENRSPFIPAAAAAAAGFERSADDRDKMAIDGPSGEKANMVVMGGVGGGYDGQSPGTILRQ